MNDLLIICLHSNLYTVVTEVGDKNSGKAGNDKELGDCSSWDGDKSDIVKLSYLSAKVWAMTELVYGSCSSLNELDSFIRWS